LARGTFALTLAIPEPGTWNRDLEPANKESE
jgi:hypothetical protein